MADKRTFDAFQNRSFQIHLESLKTESEWDPTHRPCVPLTGDFTEKPSRVVIDDPMLTATHHLLIKGREFSITGNSVLCRCPDCSAPMTVRVWLALGSCWRCGCSLALTEEIVDAIQTALARQTSNGLVKRPNVLAIPDVPRPRAPDEQQLEEYELRKVSSDAQEKYQELERLAQSLSTGQLITSFLNSLPAWLVSFLLHLFLILILALFVLRQQTSDSLSLVVSTFLDSSRTEGGQITLENPDKQLADDLLPESQASEAEFEAQKLDAARRDAQELLIDLQPLVKLPNLDDVKQDLVRNGERTATFAARDPRLRQEIIEREGGTTLTEAAVSRGLRWLASVQNKDGSWSLANYARHENPKNAGDSAGTSLALLPFLGAGQTHELGVYKSTVTRGLAWLLEHQKPNGDLRADFPGQAGMYAHGQATICLCEAYAMTGDERFREPAQKALKFIEQAQHRGGGWRYEPNQEGDTSVFGWQLMALQSARASSFQQFISDDTLRLADYFLDTVSTSNRYPDGALYRYQPGENQATPSMTAEGILCRMYLGWKRDDPRLMYAVNWLVKKHLPTRDTPNLYYWYYGTQSLHHFGGREWQTWNLAVRELLVDMQESSGIHAGSWNPRDFEWGAQGERIFVTSLAVCTLEVYYRHLPLFKPIDLD